MYKARYLRPQLDTKGLVAYWRLDVSPTSTTVFDYSLNGSLGTVTNAIPSYPGFLFDGTDDQIDCGSAAAIDDIFVGGGTCSLWLLSDGLGESNLGRAIGKNNWRVDMVTNTTTMRFQQNFTGDDGQWTFPISAGVWQHVTVVYDNDLSANNPVVYVNGVSVAVTEVQAPGAGDTDTADAGSDFYIGDAGGSTVCWDGLIGDVKLFNITKTASEAKSLFELTRGKYGV